MSELDPVHIDDSHPCVPHVVEAADALARAAASWAFCPQQSIIARDKQLQSLKDALAAYEEARGNG